MTPPAFLKESKEAMSTKRTALTSVKYYVRNAEAVVRRCSVKRYFLKFHKIHRKTPVPESLFYKKKCENKNLS